MVIKILHSTWLYIFGFPACCYEPEADVWIRGIKKGANPFVIIVTYSLRRWSGNTLKQISGKEIHAQTRELSAILFPFRGKSFPDRLLKGNKSVKLNMSFYSISAFISYCLFSFSRCKDTQLIAFTKKYFAN